MEMLPACMQNSKHILSVSIVMQTIVTVWENVTLYSSRKYPYLPHRRSLDISRGRGCQSKEKTFQIRGRKTKLKNLPGVWEGYGYFLEQYNSCSNSISCSPKLPLVFPWLCRTPQKLLSICIVCDSKVC